MDEQQIISPTYRQKSQLFLWPLLMIPRKVGFRPLRTFIRDPFLKITEADCKIVAVFPTNNSTMFGEFEELTLLSSPFYSNFYETANLLVYIFDLSPYKADFDLFLQGKYSEFSINTKGLINDYYAKQQGLKRVYHPQIKAYLSPTEKIHVQVANQLSVDVYDIMRVKEIVDKPNLERETFDESKISTEGTRPSAAVSD